jgi:putative hydrolase of HD superfamily
VSADNTISEPVPQTARRGEAGSAIWPLLCDDRRMSSTRLEQQIAFLKEIDRLKSVERRTALIDRTRLENSAEHSWHLSMMALVLAEHAPEGTDTLHAIRMLLVHDLVEIDAGDTFAFDPAANRDKAAREAAAADRLFALLPPDLETELRALWDEFETGATATARFAIALDRFAGLLQNWGGADGGTWRKHGVTRDAVLARMAPIRGAVPALWPFVTDVVEAATSAGFIAHAGRDSGRNLTGAVE